MSKILRLIIRNKKAMTFKQLLKTSGLDPKSLKRELRDLAKQGKIEKYRNGTFVAKDKPDSITGKLDLHPDGYGFLSHDGEGKDIFIPKNKMNGAMHGDRVKISPERFRGKMEGRIIEIVERSEQTIVGRVENLAGIMRVIPMTRKINTMIYLTSNKVQYENDSVVLVEITHFPSERSAARGHVTKVIGKLTDPGIEDEIVLHRYDIEKVYPENVIEYVESTQNGFMAEPGARTDLRDITTVTIDGETAKDFDDAISIENSENEFVLYVHIADVSHFVRPGTPVDNEAYRRGTSFYFPQFAIPMLPESLSNGLCSLRPNEDRLTLTAKITYTKDGQRKKSHFYRSIINSDRRLTYDYVQDVLEKNSIEKDKNILKLIKDSKELAKKIMVRRDKNGMLDFDFPEATFQFDDDGEIASITPAERHISHRIIEHFMIEANEVVSEFLEEHTKKSVYRIHDKPDPMKLQDFSGLAETFGVTVTIKDVTSKDVRIINRKVNESEHSEILGSALVRTMAKAEYNTNNIGHFGLASESYTHFTSPIRRYPDLMVHRLICNKLFGAEYYSENELDDSCKLSTENEQRAENAERDIHKFKKLKYLSMHMEEPFAAIIMSVGAFGLNIYIESIMLKATVPLESIPGDIYQFVKKEQLVRGRITGKIYRTSDIVEVLAERIDIDMQEAYFYIGK